MIVVDGVDEVGWCLVLKKRKKNLIKVSLTSKYYCP